MCDRDGLWQDTSDDSDDEVDEENNNVENEDDDTVEWTGDADEDNLNLNHDLQQHNSEDAEPEQAIFDIRRIVPQEVHDEVVAENIESNQIADVMIVGEDIAVEIVSETAIVADSTEDESDEEMVELPVINTATTAEVLGISSDSEAEFDASEDTIDVGETHSLPTPGGTSRVPTPAAGPSQSHSQPQSPISVFYQTTGIAPHTSTSSSKSVSRGKRFPWTSYNNFGFSSDSEDETDARPSSCRPGTVPSVVSVTTSMSTHSHSFYPYSGDSVTRVPRIVSDPHDTSWSFSRATNILPATRPNFDQRRFLREISRVEGGLVGDGDAVPANQEDLAPTAGPSRGVETAGTNSGRISPATGTSALARVIYNSGVVASSTGITATPSPPTRSPCTHPRSARLSLAPCQHTTPMSSNTTRVSSNNPPSPQTSPTLARHHCTQRPQPTTLPTPPPTTLGDVHVQSQAESRRRLARDFLRALSSPPIPSVPSLPNTTIRRILSVNTNELLGGDLTSPPTSPQTSMYGPLQLQQPTVRTPRFEPVAGPIAGPSAPTPGPQEQADGGREVQSIDRIDRILQLSRRTRVINDTIERSISRDLETMRANPVAVSTGVVADTAREDVRRQAQRIMVLAEMQQQREEDALRGERGRRSLERVQQVTSNYARERAEREAESVASEFVRDATANPYEDTATLLSVESSAPKRARLEPSGQFEADIAEALKRSLADQSTGSAEPQPGCSHWQGGSGQEEPIPADDTEEAAEGEGYNEAADTVSPKPPDNPGPDFEGMYRSLQTSHRKLVTELQSSLECPVCLDTIRAAPVQCCRNGHLICSLCMQRTHICPTCRAPMTLQSGQRCVSHSANRLVDLLPHPCTNRDSGCEVEELLATLTQHEQDCPYRLVRCPIGYCMDNIPMASLSAHVSAFPHLLTTHAYPAINASVNSTSTNDTNLLTFSRYIPSQGLEVGSANPFQLRSFDPIRFTFSGSIFYLQTITSPDRRLLYNFVQLEGTKGDCAKYWASITVCSFSPFTASQVCQTVRPTQLDLHCRDDLQSIGEALLMTEK